MKKTILTGLFLSLFFPLASFTSIVKKAEQSLINAVIHNDLQEVQRLIENQVNVDATTDHNGQTVLEWAADNDHKEIVEILINNNFRGKATRYIENSYGWTALMWAAFKGNQTIVKYLADNNADIHARTKYGVTALTLAKSKDNTDVINYLTSLGAE